MDGCTGGPRSSRPRRAARGFGTLSPVVGRETGRLLDAALARDDGALGDLLERLRPRLVLWAATRLSPELKAHVDPEDVAQIALLAVHRDFAGFTGSDGGRLLAWVFSVAENRIRDLSRRFGAGKRTPAAADEVARALAGRRRFSQTSPSQAAVRSEAVRRMHRAIERLSETHQTIVRLRNLEMRDYDEIVAAMELASVGAARTLHCRAMIALRHAMQAEGGEA